MYKFISRKEVWPAVRVIGVENTEICFNLLVDSLHLSIILGVVGSGELDIVFEKSC